MPCGREHKLPGDPPPVHWHLFENASAPDLPARQPGESEQDYRRRLNRFTAAWSGRRARLRKPTSARQPGVIA